MPELPEVETVMRGLSPVLKGNSISCIKLYRPDLRIPFPVDMEERLASRRILSLKRRAKYILVSFEGGLLLAVHLGMSGRVLINPKNNQYDLKKHDHMVITFKDGAQIIYNDPRRFGMVFVLKESKLETHSAFRHLGPEPLGNKFSAPYLAGVLKNKKVSIKQALLDQKVVVGVGNIYASEALYQSKINPLKPACDLSRKKLEELVIAVRDVLTRAIEAGGSTLKDYRHADGGLGYFQYNFRVYDQAGAACPDCTCDINRTGGVQRIVQSGRSTFYCPTKQK